MQSLFKRFGVALLAFLFHLNNIEKPHLVNTQGRSFEHATVTEILRDNLQENGSRIGDRLWGSRGRYVLRVRYYRSVVNPAVLWEALSAFQQSHVFLWFEDISGVGGSYAPN